MSQDWNTLLVSCQRGDQAGRESLFSALRVRLVKLAQYRLRGQSIQLIEDLVQSTLTVVVERIAEIESNPDLFALQILRNKIGDHLRVRSRRLEQRIDPTGSERMEDSDEPAGLVLADPDAMMFETAVESTELVQTVRRAIQRLSPICQALFVGMLEGRSINEVWELAAAGDKHLSRSTFDKRLFDCRKRLRLLVKGAF